MVLIYDGIHYDPLFLRYFIKRGFPWLKFLSCSDSGEVFPQIKILSCRDSGEVFHWIKFLSCRDSGEIFPQIKVLSCRDSGEVKTVHSSKDQRIIGLALAVAEVKQ